MASRAEDFFQRIMAGEPTPADFLKRLVGATPPVFEDEWLDFKCEPKDENDLKRIWSKLLSAFSNTEGGVLVWGIDARPDPITKVDAASTISPIANTAKFKSRLLQLLHEVTDPPTQGVRIEQIAEPANPTSGYVVCLIPESDQKPVRAELADRNYFIRSGESSKVINRSLLRSLFYPQAKAAIEIVAGCGWQSSKYPNPMGDIEVCISNIGTATARELYILVERQMVDAELVPIDFAGPDWVKGRTPEGISLTCRIPLHPSQMSVLLHDNYTIGYRTEAGLGILGESSVKYDFVVYGLDAEAQHFTVFFDREAIEQSATRKAIRSSGG